MSKTRKILLAAFGFYALVFVLLIVIYGFTQHKNSEFQIQISPITNATRSPVKPKSIAFSSGQPPSRGALHCGPPGRCGASS